MTIPSSSIAFSHLQAEYGGGAPIALSEYYGQPGIPSSGQLAMSYFAGKNFWGFNGLYGGTGYATGYGSTGLDTASCMYTLSSNGHEYGPGSEHEPLPDRIAFVTPESDGPNWEVYAAHVGGFAPNKGPFATSTWYHLGTYGNVYWIHERKVVGYSESVLDIYIRRGGSQWGPYRVTLGAENFGGGGA